MKIQEFLGLDVGKARIGIARASMHARLAEPITTLKTDGIYDHLNEIIKQHGSDALVVGLPTNSKGQDTAQTTWVRQWVKEAKQRINKPFYWQDEELSSKIAHMQQIGTKKTVHGEDALAAAIILQDFLDSPESSRMLC